ncbi:hypothetical protein EC968_007254 [Mortierella alpina]|nr:hypothetical protein EC968_007254 [Mortierella alpina]
MRAFNLRKHSSDAFSSSRVTFGSMSRSLFSTITILSTVLSLSSLSPSSLVSAAPNTPGFCGDCQTFSNAIAPCGATFTNTDIEISGTYIPPQSAAKCICTEVLQKVLWNCARCELLAGFNAHSQPPQAYQTQCIGWGMVQSEWKAPYTGVVAPGTSTPLTGGTNPPGQPPAGTSGSGSNPTSDGTTSGTASGTGSMPNPSDGSTSDGGSGPNGTAIGISVGIMGVAVVAGVVFMFMLKRRRNRRHAPLELGDHYVGMDDHQWEKPSRPQSPMIPASVATGAPVASRGPMQAPHRPSPFESRPGGGGSVVGGYDGQYDQYEPYGHGGNGGGGGYDTYSNHGGYDPSYRQGPPQGYPPRDYAYEHAMPTSGTPLPPYHGGKSDGGHYM